MGLSVAEKIRLIMKRQKITMGDLAEASGQTRQNLSNKMTRGNFTEKDIETQLHLLVDNNFLPVVDDQGGFQGMITRREWFKAFNYLARTFDDHYVTVDKKQVLKLEAEN